MTMVEQVTSGVWRGGTRFVNFYIVDAGRDGLVFVDTGLPRYGRHIAAALQRLGRSPEDVRGVLLTHGHVDHVGAAHVAAPADVPVYLHPADVDLARDPSLNRTQRPLRRYAWWPGTAAFLAHAVVNGAVVGGRLPDTIAVTGGKALDVPGQPTARHTPGHTEGHCVFHFPEHSALFAGDLLCTVDPLSTRRSGPQIQTRGSNRDSEQVIDSLDLVADLAAQVVLPGHGTPWRGGVQAAIASAKKIGCR